jgi:hypothetical protein
VIKGLLGEEKRQNPMELKAKVQIGFAFDDQDTIEGVIILRIDSRTTKRGIFGVIGHLSSTI